MSTNFVKYPAQAGETWTSVAYKAYGKEKLTEPIIAANPTVKITCRLKQATVLYIPILTADNTAAVLPIEQQSPWQ